MAIRTNNTFPIVIASSAAPSSSPLVTHQELNITRSHQQKSEWCWAACTRMVLKSFNKNVSQCEAATFLFEEACCPESPANDAKCNLGCKEGDIKKVYRNFDVDATFLDRTVRFSTIQREIQERGRPVEACIEWEEDGAHVIVIYGWRVDGSSKFVRIHDSLFGTAEVIFSELKRYRAQGKWTLTWLGFKERED